MAKIAGLAVAGALLTMFAVVSISSAQERLEVTLDSLEGSEITGTATLIRTDDGNTDVVLVGRGLDPDGEPHMNHIHDGTGCGDGEYGAVVISLPDLADTDAVSDGVMVSRNIVSETDAGDPISFEEIADGNHVLILHDLDGTPAACGMIAPLAAEEADEAASDGDADAEAETSTEKAPVVGSGGALDRNGGAGQAMLLAATLAALGMGGVGAAFAVRRTRR